MVALGGEVLAQYRAISRFNSPYPAHDRGHAVDLYPAEGAPSPVAGEVTQTRTVRAPTRPAAEPDDHLIVIDTGEHLARILHVEPAVAVGERVAVGDDLGRPIRSGYFAPWVDDHLHLGFRPADADPVRATGSLPVGLDINVEPVRWDGTGTVLERGETSVILDAPAHPNPGACFAGIAAAGGIVDGGLPHYDGGGLLGGRDGPVRLVDQEVGVATGGRVRWADVEVRANGVPVTGLSIAFHRDRLGAKLVSWDGVPAALGERVTVEIVPSGNHALTER